MARHTGQLYSGVIAKTNVRDNLLIALHDHIISYQESLTDVWNRGLIATDIANTHKIFHSWGDPNLGGGLKGDASIFIELFSTDIATILVRTYSDWTSATNSGNRVNSITATDIHVKFEDTIDLQYYLFVNAYEIVCILEQIGSVHGNYHAFVAGQPFRYHIPASRRGTAFVSGATGSGASVQVALDRDIRNTLQVGQHIWLIDQTPENDALLADHVEIGDIESIGSDGMSIVVDNLASAFSAGALVGLDPQNVLSASADGPSSGEFGYVVHRADGTNVSGSAAQFDHLVLPDGVDAFGILQFAMLACRNTSGPQSIRGVWQNLVCFQDTLNAIAPLTIYYPNDNPDSGFITQDGALAGAGYKWAMRYVTP